MTDPSAVTPGAPRSRHNLIGGLVLVAVLLGLYVPCAGSYTLWDPWETHYAEVARSMNATGDYLSPRWQNQNFWSKPAGHLWLLAGSMRLLGVGRGAPDEMVASSRVEWSLRLPIIFLSIFGIWALWLMVTRLVSRRAGWLAAIALATMPQWLFITRQAMTDMPDVGLMTGGLALFFLALKDEASERPLRTVTPLRLSAFHLVLLVVVVAVLLQTIDFYFGLVKGFGNRRIPPLVAVGHMAPYVAMLLGFGLFGWLRVRTRRHLLLVLSYLTFAVAVLMKGLLGVAIPGMVVVAYLIVTWDFRILKRAELHLGVLLVLAVAAPWYHAMIALHGFPFYREMFIQHHFQRLAVGVHGDKGSFDYFLIQLGTGTFPWAALAPAALAHVLTSRPGPSIRGRTVVLGAVWFVATYALFSFSVTKFHHYILPALPGLAVVVAVYLDDLLADRVARPALGILLSVGFVVVMGANLAAKPINLLLLFVYNYTRAFPALNFTPAIWAFVAACGVPLLFLLWRDARRIALVVGTAAALAFGIWCLDVYMLKVSPHWGQKHLIAKYYARRQSPEERLIAWQMNWRGENFYTKGEIAGKRPDAWTVFMSLNNTPMLNYLKKRTGRKFFFLLEHKRLARFKRLLPTEQSKKTFRIEDDKSNNKFLLVSATI